MDSASPPHSSLSDISGNLFAALIVVVLALSTELHAHRPPQPQHVDISAADAVLRQPLSAAAMIRAFYDRRASAAGLSIDVLGHGVELSGSNRSPLHIQGSGDALRQSLAAAIRSAPGDIRLFIFSNELYPATTSVLRAAGRPFVEIVPPQALRNGRGDAWSSGFTRLLADAHSFAAFTSGLQSLLAAEGGSPRTGGAGATDGSGAPAPPEILADFWRAWDRALLILGVMFPIGASLIIEAVSRKPSGDPALRS